ncbi:MAG TPA: HEAT repeat domain-containing protein [Pirellulales bacterium]|nr:HEAT repeat domain-containing protein [Pirellulales bacterium]
MKRLTTALIVAFWIACAVVRADPPAPAATPPQAALIDVLKSNASQEQKAAACRQLAWIGNRDAVPVLAGLLGDEKLSHMARYALERISDPSVEDVLRAAVPKLKGKLLAGVLSSLGAKRDEKSISLLLEHTADSDAHVANAAVFALGKIGTPAAADALLKVILGGPTVAKPKLWDGKAPLVAGPPLHIKPAVCDAALRCADKLVADGHPARAIQLYGFVEGSDAPIQYRVAATRGEILHEPHSQQMLAELLRSDDRAMFNLALQLAHELPSAEATATYAAQIAKLPAARQSLLIQALGVRGDKAALPAIRAVVGQSDPLVRIAAVRSLALLNDTQSLPAILAAAVAPEKGVSEAAIAAIVKMPAGEADAALVKMVDSPDRDKQLVAIQCLGRRHTAAATRALLKIAAESEPQARQAAMKALAGVASEADLPQTIGVLLKAGSPAEQASAENVVAAICVSAPDKESCTAKIVAAMTGANADQQAEILRLLATVGGANGLQAVREAIKSGANQAREAGVAALCKWPDQAAAPDLLALARDPNQPSNKLRALRGFLRLALDVDLSADKRLEMSATATPLVERDDERRLLLRVLSRVQSAKAFDQISPFLDVPSVRSDAAAAAIAVAGNLARAADVRLSAAAIIVAMGKVKQAKPSADLVRRANDLQERVRSILPKKS